MKRLLLLYLLLYTSISFGQSIDTLAIDAGFPLGSRKVVIYLPEAYKVDPERKFEVAYVLDAQQREIFDAVHSTISFQSYNLAPMIVVGIISENRNKDFLPANKHKETLQELRGQLGNADAFQQFISNNVFPLIEKKYRTIPTRIGIGFSNGGTFLNYTLLTKPEMFDVYFSIDANFNYDRGQLVDKIVVESSKNGTLGINSKKFYYTCQTPMNENWLTNSKKFNSFLEKEPLKDKIVFKQDIFENESHQTVFQIGVMNAFKEYFKYQFFNSENLITYYKSLEKNGGINFGSKDINRIAVTFLNNGLKQDAKKIVTSFQDRLDRNPSENTSLLDLFETGNLYLELGFNPIALDYFRLTEKLLEKNRQKMSIEEYNYGKQMITNKLKQIKAK
ncbi:alpha/beta hydrolase [Pontibacter cellulosilyticus]|uniref:Alpha/beta hydrolase n=1 Tax=Pontibacter cellulosilyticus TaxID=1720253 RepID=A0A923N4F6_9BACT|nr:alpha/beta hydrolase-fold protein [Pontibacter cellulosilyticus]MBC5991276.1 alpha/beta hydrolase [Pontibacter cellulosilyticus]